jgi:hypothetical protein
MSNEHQGEGGTFLLDPETGEVTLIQQTTDPETPNEVKTDGTADKKKSHSNRSRKQLRN